MAFKNYYCYYTRGLKCVTLQSIPTTPCHLVETLQGSGHDRSIANSSVQALPLCAYHPLPAHSFSQHSSTLLIYCICGLFLTPPFPVLPSLTLHKVILVYFQYMSIPSQSKSTFGVIFVLLILCISCLYQSTIKIIFSFIRWLISVTKSTSCCQTEAMHSKTSQSSTCQTSFSGTRRDQSTWLSQSLLLASLPEQCIAGRRSTLLIMCTAQLGQPCEP